MFFIFSTPVLIRHVWQSKTVVFLHWCLIRTVLLAGMVISLHSSVDCGLMQTKMSFIIETNDNSMQTNYRGLIGPQTKRLQIVPAAPIIPLLNERFDLS